MYSIGEIAKKVGIKIPTLRYYENAGLIPHPDRSAGGQRRYSESDLERLAFVKHARQLGFSLDRIGSLIQLSEGASGDCDDVHNLAESHLAAVGEKLRMLRDLERELERITLGCRSGHVDECYIIQSLSNHALCESDHEETQPSVRAD